jgi:hypothetical protein
MLYDEMMDLCGCSSCGNHVEACTCGEDDERDQAELVAQRERDERRSAVQQLYVRGQWLDFTPEQIAELF